MPLMKGKSRQAFSHNVSAEMHAGKPQRQAVAIAYAVKRRMKNKAHGGEIHNNPKLEQSHMADGGIAGYADGGTVHTEPAIDPEKAKELEESFKAAVGHAEGGIISAHDIVHAVRHKMAYGGDTAFLEDHMAPTDWDGHETYPDADHIESNSHESTFDGNPRSPEYKKGRLSNIFEKLRQRHMGR